YTLQNGQVYNASLLVFNGSTIYNYLFKELNNSRATP
ncbi:MAG: hypothetical protein ACI83B_004057, partial [Sediminicola sp.]